MLPDGDDRLDPCSESLIGIRVTDEGAVVTIQSDTLRVTQQMSAAIRAKWGAGHDPEG